MRRKITTTVYITPEQSERLKALHGKTKVPVAQYIRQGIDLVLEKNHTMIPHQLSLYQDPEKSEGKSRRSEEGKETLGLTS